MPKRDGKGEYDSLAGKGVWKTQAFVGKEGSVYRTRWKKQSLRASAGAGLCRRSRPAPRWLAGHGLPAPVTPSQELVGRLEGSGGLAGWWPPRASSGLGPCPRLSDLIRSHGAGGKVPGPRWALSSGKIPLRLSWAKPQLHLRAHEALRLVQVSCSAGARGWAEVGARTCWAPAQVVAAAAPIVAGGGLWVVVVSGWWILQPQVLFN